MSIKRRSPFAIAAAILLLAGTLYLSSQSFSRIFGSPSPHEMKAPPLQSAFTSLRANSRAVNVALNYDKVESNETVAEVTARVSAPYDFNRSMSFRWKLGDGVELVDGAEEGLLQGLRKDEEITIRIKVTGFSLQENHQIGFEINGSMNGKFVHGDALIASDLENTFENTVQNVERIKASQ
jgi:hypothetical protein